MDLFGIPRRLQVADCSNLIWVDFNSVVGNHITQKLARAHSKRTLSNIEVQFMSPQYFENIPKVIYMLGLHFTLYHHIIYIHLNIVAQLRIKHPGHHPLVSGPCILQSKGHYFVVVISNGCKKTGLFQIVQS